MGRSAQLLPLLVATFFFATLAAASCSTPCSYPDNGNQACNNNNYKYSSCISMSLLRGQRSRWVGHSADVIDENDPFAMITEFYGATYSNSYTYSQDKSYCQGTVGGSLVTWSQMEASGKDIFANGCYWMDHSWSGNDISGPLQPYAKFDGHGCGVTGEAFGCAVEMDCQGSGCSGTPLPGVCQPVDTGHRMNDFLCARDHSSFAFFDEANNDDWEHMLIPFPLDRERSKAVCTKFAAARVTSRSWPWDLRVQIYNKYKSYDYDHNYNGMRRYIRTNSEREVRRFTTYSANYESGYSYKDTDFIAFVCSREKVLHGRNFRTKEGPVQWGRCYQKRKCEIRIDLPFDVSRVHTRTNVPMSGTMTLSHGPFASSPVSTTASIPQGDDKSAWFEFTAPAGTGTARVYFDPGEAQMVKRNGYSDFWIKELESLTIKTPATWPQVVFQGQSWSGVLTRTDNAASSSPGETVCCTGSVIASYSSPAWTESQDDAAFTLVFKSDAPVNSDTQVHWTVAHRFFNDTTPTYAFDVRPKGTVTAVQTTDKVVAEQPAVFTVSLSHASYHAYAMSVAVVDATACPVTLTNATLSWAASSAATLTFGVEAAASITAPTSCAFAFTTTESSPQFDAPGNLAFVIQPRLNLRVENLPTTLSTLTAYAFTIKSVVPGATTGSFWFGAATLAPNCTGTTIVPTGSAELSTGSTSRGFTLTTGASGGSTCELVIGVSGSSAGHINNFSSVTLTIGSIGQLSATTSAESIFVGQALTLTIADATEKLVLLETANVTWTWTGTAGGMLGGTSTGSVIVSVATRSVDVGFTAAVAGNGTFSFAVSGQPGSISSTLAPVALTVEPLKHVSVQNTLPQNVSTGSKYGVAVRFSVPSLPLSGVVTVTPSYNATLLTATPGSVSWSSGESVNVAKTITFAAVAASDGVATPTNVTTSGNATEFAMGVTHSTGSTVTYRRVTLNTTTTLGSVYLVTGARLRVTYNLSEPLPVGMAPYVVHYVSTVAGKYTLTAYTVIMPGTTGGVIEIKPEAVSPPGSPYVAPVLWWNSSALYTSWLGYWLEPDVEPLRFEVLTAMVVSVSCNATELYVGPGNVVGCNVSVPHVPATGAVQLSVSDEAGFGFGLTPATFTFPAGGQAWVMVEVTPPGAPGTFSDLSTRSLRFALVDTSFSFDTAVRPTVSLTLRKLKQLSLQLVGPASVILPSTPFNVSVSGAPVNLTVTAVAPGAGFSFAPAAVETEASAAARNISVTVATPQTLTLVFAVSGDATYAATTTALGITMPIPPRLTLSSQVNETLVTAPTTFVGQLRQVTVSTGEANRVPVGMSLTVGLAYNCSGAAAPGSVAWAASSVTIGSNESTAVSNFTANGLCASGVVVVTSVTGPARYHYLPPLPRGVNIVAAKTVSAAWGSSRVYGGGVNQTTLRIAVSGEPLQASPQSLVVSLANVNHGAITGMAAVTVKEYQQGSTLVETFNRMGQPVPAVTRVTSTLGLSGVAASEYALATASVFVDVYPVTNVSVNNALQTTPTLYIGETVTVRVSLPEAPLNAGGSVVVAPAFAGAPSAVELAPASATLSGSQLYQDFTVKALDTTTGSETVTFTFPSGDAHQYFPQPAARQWPVTFKALGKVTVGTVPREVFEGLTTTIEVTITEIPPAGYGNVVLTATSADTGKLAVQGGGTATWTAGSTDALTKTITVVGGTPTASVILSFALSAPAIVEPTLNTVSADLTVKDARSVIITLPPYVYVTKSGPGSVQLVKLPAVSKRLDLDYTLSTGSRVLEILPRPMSFTSSSSKTMEIAVSGLVVAPTVSISFSRANDEDAYDTPPAHTMEVRALETVTATGIPGAMYVGTQATVEVAISRLPQCTGSYLTVKPVFGTSDGTFTPANKTWLSTDSGSLRTSFLLSAVTETVAAIPVTFELHGDCLNIYEASARQAVAGTHVLAKESVGFSLPGNMTDASGGFTYEANEVVLTVDLGAPQLAHSGVTVAVGYSGTPGTVQFNETSVAFAAGVHRRFVSVRGLTPSTPFAITASVTAGSDAFVVPGSMPVLRVVERIPVRVNFNPATYLLVANTSRELQFEVTTTSALVGSMTASLSYGPELNMTNSITVAPKTPALTKQFAVVGLAESAESALNVVLSGPAAGFYNVLTPSFSVAVRRQRWVEVAVSPAFVYVGALNVRLVTLRLASLPTLAGDAVYLTLTSSPSLRFNVGTAQLSAGTPNVTVSVEGLQSGATDLSSYIRAASQSVEYANSVLYAPGAARTVEVRNRLRVSLGGYVGTIYAERSITFEVTIPLAPLTGALGITAVLAQPGYGLVSTPAVLWFNGSSGPLTQNLTLTAPATVLASTALRFMSAGSPEYEAQAAAETVEVILQNQLGFAGWSAAVYPGAANQRSFTVSVSRLPDPGNTLTITPTSSVSAASSKVRFEPTNVTFTNVSALAQQISVVGLPIPYGSVTETVAFVMNDTQSFYEALSSQAVTVNPYENATTSIDRAVVYRLETLTVTIDLSVAPTEDMTITMAVRKNATGASQTMVAVPASEAFVAASSKYVTGLTKATFTVRAQVAPLSALLSFTLSGPGATRYQRTFLKEYLVRFVPLRSITAVVPPVMYLGLRNTMSVTVERAPEEGDGVIVVTALLDSALNTTSAVFRWDAPTQAVTTEIELYPTAIGSATVSFQIGSLARGFQNAIQPASQFSVLVREPSKISLVGMPAAAFVGEPNKLSLSAQLSDPLVGDEQVFVTLTANESLSISPTAEVDLAEGSAVWTVYRDGSAAHALFELGFRATVNRWVLDPSVAEGVAAYFRPLKKITVAVPSQSSYIVGEAFTFTITLPEAPQPGASLLANLQYGGSPTNVKLPDVPAQWTSDTSSLVRTIQASGNSPTTPEAITVAFSNDASYDLTPVVYFVKFDPLFILDTSLAAAVFLSRKTTLTVFNQEQRVVSVTPSVTPAGAVTFNPSVLNFVNEASTGRTQASGTFEVTGAALAKATISFALSGGDASKYNEMQSEELRVIGQTAIRVDVPSQAMKAYLGTSGVDVTVELPRAPETVPVNVTPTWSLTCDNGFADFSVSPLEFRPGGPTKITFTIRPIRANSPCALQFPVTSSPEGFVSPSSLYTVEARSLYNVSLTRVPTRLFPGDANRAALEVSLDADTPLPLDKPVNVSFVSLDPACIGVSPPSLLWAAGNAREPLAKVVFVTETPTGTCIKDGQRVGISGTAASKILQVNLPAVVSMDVKPLLTVTAKEPAFSSTDYYVFKGDSSLSFSVTLQERLVDGESMTVRAVYVGNEGKITANEAVWKGSASAATQYIVLEGKEIAPHSKLEFRVTGPPRYEALARGGGFLEVFGPLSVTAEVPRVMLAGLTYNFKVTVQDRPFPGETLLITPVWEGRNESLSFAPGALTWQSNTLTLQQTMVITTHEVSGAYMLDMTVRGSTRFVTTAFRDTVEIRSPQVITTRGVPIQMMVGESYSMTVDIGALPASIHDSLRVLVAAQRYNSLDCLTLSASELEFSSADPLAPTSQTVTLRAIRTCPLRDVRFAVTGNASLAYNRTVVPRPFTTVAASAVAVAWPVESYVGAENQPEAFITVKQLPAAGKLVNVSINATCAASVRASEGAPDVVSYPRLLTWTPSDAAEKPVSLVGLTASACTFAFTVSSDDAGFPAATTVPAAVTSWFALLNLTRTAFPAQIYAGQGNQAEMTVSLSSHLQQPGGEALKVVRLRPSSTDSRIVFQPPVLEWYPGASPQAKVFVWARSEVAEANITFAVEGDGTSLVARTPPAVTFGVTPLLQIEYTNPPEELFVNDNNAAYVNLTVPNNTALNVTGIVDGDRNAIRLSPSVLVWTATSPRTQTLKLLGLYGTEVRCRLRYQVSGPPFVEMAPGSAQQQVRVRALQTVSRTPNDLRLVLPEQTVQTVRWTPSRAAVTCTTTDNSTFIARNATDGLSYVYRTAAGFVGASCTVNDTTFATPSLFEVEATAKKRLTIPAVVNAYVGIDTKMTVSLSEKPSDEDNRVTLDFDNVPTYIRFSPNTVRFSPTSAKALDVLVTGLNATTAPIVVLPNLPNDKLSDEYRRPSFLGTRVMVRDRVRLTIELSMTATRVSTNGSRGELVAYNGAKNGVQMRLRLSAPTLTGPVRVTPQYYTEDRDPATLGMKQVFFSKPAVIFYTGAEILTASLDVTTKVPVDYTKLSFYATGPAEFIGGTTEMGRVTFVGLERVEILQDTLPPVVYVGVRNAAQLGIRLTGHPGTDKVVEVEAIPSTTAVTVTPKFLVFDSELDVADAPLTKYFTVTGMSAQDDLKITLNMMQRSRAASNFDTQLRRTDYANADVPESLRQSATVYTSVRPLMAFDVVDPATKQPKRVDEFFNSEGVGDNSVVCEVALDGLPVSDGVASVEVAASDPTLVSISPQVLQFSKRSGSPTAKVTVFGLNATQENVTLQFALTGPPEYAPNRRVTVKLGILAKLDFEARGVPPFVAVGVANTKTFEIRPAMGGMSIATSKDTAGGAACSGVAFSAADKLEWTDQTWKRVAVSADTETAANVDGGCELFVEKKAESVDASKFVRRPFAATLRAYAAPTVSAPADVEVSVARVKTGFEFPITLNGAEVYQFLERQAFDVVAVNATIAVSSTSAATNAFASRMAANKQLIKVVSLTKKGRVLTLRIGGDGAYTTPKRETVTLEVLPGAIEHGITARERQVTFTVQGEKDELVSSTAASVISNGAGAAAVAGGAMSLGAATSAGKLETIMKAYNCPNPDWKFEQEDLGWSDRPIPMSFGSIEDLGTFAAVGVSNSLCILIYVLLHLGLAYGVYLWRQNGPFHDKSFSAARALVRFPSMALFPVLFFYQGTVSASMLATLYSPVAGLRMAGATTLLACGLGLPLFMWTRVGPGFLGKYEKTELSEGQREKMSLWRKLLMRDGKWDNPEHRYWCLRYGMFFDEMRGGYQWWLFVDVCVVMVLGIIDGVVPTTRSHCQLRNYANVAVFALQLVGIVAVRPYRIPVANAFFVIAFVLQLVSMVLITVAYDEQTPQWWGVEVSTQCLFFFSGLLMIKSIADAIVAFNEFTGIEKMLEQPVTHSFGDVAEADEVQIAAMSKNLNETFQEDVAMERARLTGGGGSSNVQEAAAFAGVGGGAAAALGMSSKRAAMEREVREEQRRQRVLNDGSTPSESSIEAGVLQVPGRREPVMKKRVNPQVERLLGRRRELDADEFDDL